METWVMGVGLRPGGKPPDEPPNPKTVARHRSIPTISTSHEMNADDFLPGGKRLRQDHGKTATTRSGAMPTASARRMEEQL